MMKISILSIFPEMFTPLKESIIGRAIEKNLIKIDIVNPRDFSTNKHKKVDDYSFGGGPGMVMMPQPIFDAIDSLGDEKGKIFYMSPRGKVLNEEKVREIAALDKATFLCGHYEGIDQRIIEHYDIEEISIGDYVLTGGELAAMVVIDSACRLIPGVLAGESSADEESIYSGLLEFPQYTQPRDFRDEKVPEVLLSGNHKLIELWRFEQSLLITKRERPDLFEKYVETHKNLGKEKNKVMEKVLKMM